MGHCLRFVVTSRALSSVGDIHVVQMLIKPYVPSDKLEGSSVVNPVVDVVITFRKSIQLKLDSIEAHQFVNLPQFNRL